MAGNYRIFCTVSLWIRVRGYLQVLTVIHSLSCLFLLVFYRRQADAGRWLLCCTILLY